MTLHLHPRVAVTTTDTGMVLLDQNSGRYWELNPTAATVIQVMMDGGVPEQAVQNLVRRTSVTAERASRDVTTFLDTLRSRGLAVTE
ncbi:lasso peptide biosynthesis PqqD family chaperone [Amycolatopsis sp. NPDC052450]|uniref:lasso peptide biosynthesis PqqD family chaperone n=1 Tax=Amycolatopsis sp. NPDC052450 TaxID=3363937 RepID=UPI0037C62BDA